MRKRRGNLLQVHFSIMIERRHAIRGIAETEGEIEAGIQEDIQ